MSKNLSTTGNSTVLVLIGWISFMSAFFAEGLLANLVLQTVARVLPSARDFCRLRHDDGGSDVAVTLTS